MWRVANLPVVFTAYRQVEFVMRILFERFNLVHRVRLPESGGYVAPVVCSVCNSAQNVSDIPNSVYKLATSFQFSYIVLNPPRLGASLNSELTGSTVHRIISGPFKTCSDPRIWNSFPNDTTQIYYVCFMYHAVPYCFRSLNLGTKQLNRCEVVWGYGFLFFSLIQPFLYWMEGFPLINIKELVLIRTKRYHRVSR